MRVLIRADGTHSLGMGHAYRMRGLALALAARGHAVTIATLPGTPGADLFAAAGLACGDDDLALAAPADLVVIDRLDTSAALIAAARAKAKRVITFDDCGAGLAEADAVVNAIVFHGGRYRAAECAARLYEGPAYIVLQPEILEWRARARAAAGTLRVVVSVGGTDNRAVTPRLVRALEHAPGPLDILVNLGPGADGGAAVAALAASSRHAVRVVQRLPSLIAAFAEADLVLCGGGVTLYELAALGVPAAAVATEPHEVATIRWFADTVGSVRPLGRYDELDDDGLARGLAELIADSPARAAMAAAGRSAVDGRGLDRCVALCEEIGR